MIEELLLNFALMLSIEFIVIGVVIHLRYPNTLHKKTLFIVAISLAVITMCVNPTKYWDNMNCWMLFVPAELEWLNFCLIIN